MDEYHKIQSVFKRDKKTKRFIIDDWSTPELVYLHGLQWTWDEKIDGTNIRIDWKPQFSTRKFGGRTANASIPTPLLSRLEELFAMPMLQDKFPEPITFYGEGYGGKIQGGGNYRADPDFILFDVKVGDWWLERGNVEEVAATLGCLTTTIVGEGTLREAIDKVKGGFKSVIGTADAEGLVCRPKIQLFNRKGERIITKVKTKDFLERPNTTPKDPDHE